MQELYNLVEKLVDISGVSGFESYGHDSLEKIIKELKIFDETGFTATGSFYGIIRCGKENAPLVLCDAHLDTVGFIVTEICSGGFLRVAPIGGIAPKILASSFVNIYGKETIKGVFISTPPHLQSAGENEKKQEVINILIDTGMSTEKLKEIIRIGTPVGFLCDLQWMLEDTLVGASFDDRLCGAVILRALSRINRSELNVDVAFQFSTNEETGYKGAMTSAYMLNPDKAIVVDVTHAYVPGAPKVREGICAGKGVDICFSPQTNRALTKYIVNIAREKEIPFQLSAAPVRTGTNSNAIQTTRQGIPVVLLSVPLKNMHTMSEAVNVQDAVATSDLIYAILNSF